MKVIKHPKKSGFWTIQIGNSIYGCYDRKSLAVTILLTM